MNESNSRKTLSLKREDAESSSQKIEERLHKVLAQAGLGSRRALEERIASELVKVNGEIATVGQSVKGGDRIEIDGRTFVATALTEPSSVLLYNKPEGVVTTREDPEGRPTVFETLPRLKGARWISVGRLDINTTGLLLLTTDGELANALMHPSNEVEREYVVRVHGEVPDNIVDRLARGVALDDGPAKFEQIERIGSSDSHAWFRVVIKEGRNREVRRMWESQGFQVSRLKRVRYGSVALPRDLLRGHSTELDEAQVEALRHQFGLEDQPPVLTLQSVIGQRRAKGTAIKVNRDDRKQAYVNGSVNEEARELRRFDHVREERGRGRPGSRPGGKPGYKGKKGSGKPFHGPMGSDASTGARPARSGPRPPARAGGRSFRGPMDSTADAGGMARPARTFKPRGAKRFGEDDSRGNRVEGSAEARSYTPRGERTGAARTGEARPYIPRGERSGGAAGARSGEARPYAPRGERSQRPFEQRTGDQAGQRDRRKPPRGAPGGGTTNTGEFRSWYVPEGVDTVSRIAPPKGPRGPRGAGGGAEAATYRGKKPATGGGYKGAGGKSSGGGYRSDDGSRGSRGDGNRGPRGSGGGFYGKPPRGRG